MAEYINSDVKAVGFGDNIGIDIPGPIASINFDAPYAGTYVVEVDQDGSYSITLFKTLNHKNEVKITNDKLSELRRSD